MRRNSLTLLFLILCACDPAVLEKTGFKEPDPISVEVICDASEGSSCGNERLAEVLDVLLRTSAKTPGDTIRLWSLGNTVGETKLVSEAKVPKPRKRSRKARQAELESFIKATKESFSLPLVHRRASPLLDSIAKISFTRANGKRLFVVVSDAREYSRWGDFECGTIPEGLPEELDWSLTGARVFFAFASMDEISAGRCELELERTVRIREFWRQALTAAGAAKVEFRTGNISAEDVEER